jgi:Zn-dependent protease
MRQANFWISLAGPLSNLGLAVVSVGLLAGLHMSGQLANADLGEPFGLFAQQLALTNLTLFFFNLIPVSPLDGFSVLFSVLPRSFERVEAVMREYGGMLLILIMFTGARLLSPVIISTYRFLLDLMGLTG